MANFKLLREIEKFINKLVHPVGIARLFAVLVWYFTKKKYQILIFSEIQYIFFQEKVIAVILKFIKFLFCSLSQSSVDLCLIEYGT